MVAQRVEGVSWEEIAAAARMTTVAARRRWEPIVQQ
jgi:hypothetical protein